jgi:glycosyltransferase involved in cell wall biosynthesis
VLVLSQYYWPENFRINEIVQSLAAKGVAVEVLTGKPNYPAGVCFGGYRAWGCVQETLQGIPVHRVPLLPRGKGALRLALNYLSFVLSGVVFAPWLLRGKRFDAIFVFAPSPIFQAIPAIWLGRLKKCPVLLWVQDLWPESLSATRHVTNPCVLKAVERVVRAIYRRVDLLLVQSRAFIPKVQALAGGTPIAYLPNSFIEGAPERLREEPACPGLDGGFPVLFAGNLGSAQAVDVILDAAEMLKDVEDIRFVVVGDGSRREWMMGEAARRGLSSLVFPGRFPVEAMPALMAKASALLVTLTDTEIFRLTIPSKIQAYMAAGRPILACLNGAGADLVLEAQAGLAAPAEDAHALAQTIRTLHRMPERERETLGANGRGYFQAHFSHEKLVEELIQHVRQTLSRYREENP